jgi:RNA-directed DNA polymerase
MGQVLHGSATTTEAVRRAIQNSQECLRALATRHGINPKTVAKWKKRTSVADLPTGPKSPTSTVLSADEEAVIVAFRRHTLLPLDDCLYALQPTIPAPDALVASPVSAASRDRASARHRGRQAGQEEVQELPDRLLSLTRPFGSHRHCRSADRPRQTLPVCGH